MSRVTRNVLSVRCTVCGVELELKPGRFELPLEEQMREVQRMVDAHRETCALSAARGEPEDAA